MSTRTALIRRPGPAMADGIVTHMDRVPVAVDLAVRQWDAAYVRAMPDNGWDLVEVARGGRCAVTGAAVTGRRRDLVGT